jgi:hypothetical protein
LRQARAGGYMLRMRRAILAAGVLLLAAACGASGGGVAPGTPVRAQTVVQAPQATAVPKQRPAQPTPVPAQAPAAQPARPAPAPTSSGSSGAGSGPAVIDDGGKPPCPIGTNPPLHKICPE